MKDLMVIPPHTITLDGGQEDKVLMQRDLFDSKEAIGNILLLLADKVKHLEDSHRDNVDESFPHVKK